MKKRIFLILLCVLTLTVSMLLFSACNDEEEPDKGGETGNNASEGGSSGGNSLSGGSSGGESGTTNEKLPITPSEGLEYELSDDENSYTVIGIGTCTDTVLVIPSEYNGKPVIGIGEYAFKYYTFTSVIIPDSVTSIGEGSFDGCVKLCEIVNNSSFNITKDDIERDGDVESSFLDIHTGESRIVKKNGYLFYTYDGINYLIGYTGKDTVLTLPKNYNGENYKISNLAFYNFDIVSVKISDNVTSIGDCAFAACTKITSAIIDNGVKSIGEYAFLNCFELTSVTIGKNVTSIGEGAFDNCEALENVYISDIAAWCGINFEDSKSNPLYHEGNLYLNGKLITSLVIPEGVTKIPSYAFYEQSTITSVTIPDSVTSIGSYAFYGTGYYNDDTNWEDGVLYIGKYLIDADWDISVSYTVKDGTLCIASSAFYNCTGLTSITIPDSVTYIEYTAFTGCTALKTINYRGTEEQWEDIYKEMLWDLNTGSYKVNYNYTGE